MISSFNFDRFKGFKLLAVYCLSIALQSHRELDLTELIKSSTLFLEHPNLSSGLMVFVKNTFLTTMLFPFQFLLWSLIRFTWPQFSFSLINLILGQFGFSYFLFFGVWLFWRF
jgi:hypothetical protein